MKKSIERILLLDPPFFRFLNEDQRSVPLGLAYLAGALYTRGFEDVVLYNADFDPREHLSVCNRGYYDEMSRFEAYLAAVTDREHPIYREVVATIADYRPDLIGITTRTAKFFITKTLIGLCRTELGSIPIVLGGPHATGNPDHALTRTEADYVVRGEGEDTFLELIDTLNSAPGRVDRVAGLSYRAGDQIIHNPARAFITDLDRIPFAWRAPILHRHMMRPNDFSNIFSSRGCPFTCAFCDARTTWSRKVRRHSPRYIVEEMIDIKQRYGSSFFSFQDDCLVTKEEHTLALCRELERSGLAALPRPEFRWWCEIHPRLVSERLIRKMKDAGCVAVAIGAESGSQRTLDAINKSSSRDLIRRAAKTIREAGLSLSAFFMIGFPWEKRDDIQDTLEFMEELQPDNPTVSILTPLPGTPIYEYCREQSLVAYDEDFLSLFHQRNAHFYSAHIPDDESQGIITEALQRCELLAGRRRRERISRFFKHRVAPDLQMRTGVRLELSDGSPEYSVKDSGGTQAPHGRVILDQSYTAERILIRIEGMDARRVPAQEDIERMRHMLLQEFPQYGSVEVQVAGDQGKASPASLSPPGELSSPSAEVKVP